MGDPRSGWVVGVDLGGTNVRAAGVAPDGTVLDVLSEPVDVRRDGRPFTQLVELVRALIEQVGAPPAGIGVGATGPVERATGTIDNPHTLPPAMQGPVVETLELDLGLPVALENDADAAALGEWWLGAARDADTAVLLTVGTGIGVGVVQGGRILRGARGAHGEPGHTMIDPDGPSCYCGGRGCVESLASGTAVARIAGTRGLIGDGEGAAGVHRRAAAGDAASRAVVEAAQDALARGAWSLLAAYAPDVIVLAGSALGDPERARDAVAGSLGRYTLGPPGGTRVALAELGGLAGCVGAARGIIGP